MCTLTVLHARFASARASNGGGDKFDDSYLEDASSDDTGISHVFVVAGRLSRAHIVMKGKYIVPLAVTSLPGPKVPGSRVFSA